eukprot:Blabericola_migrator_1__1645@NODE_1441_length_4539_cov_72_482111_g957_i0_p2_GENE_NODE_1441_length_4539_cov_72_482111_g957_i0NODE_1441_length_4539_cov_72_482111_g957_i0_p2_ORF_typecomplete_len337_score58_26_NODE_1441_length_4539_cov_72_482111_g957_i025303540
MPVTAKSPQSADSAAPKRPARPIQANFPPPSERQDLTRQELTRESIFVHSEDLERLEKAAASKAIDSKKATEQPRKEIPRDSTHLTVPPKAVKKVPAMRKDVRKQTFGAGLQLPDETNPDEHAAMYNDIRNAVRVDDVGGAAMLSCDNFSTLLVHFNMSAAFARFSPSRIDHNKSIVFDAVSLRRGKNSAKMEAVWRRVSVEADPGTSVFRLFDVDKKVFLASRMDLDKGVSIRPTGIRHLQGLTLGKNKPTIENFENFLSVWLENRPIPITIVGKNPRDIQDLGRVLSFVQAYKLRLKEEIEWQVRARTLMQEEMEKDGGGLAERDDFDQEQDYE